MQLAEKAPQSVPPYCAAVPYVSIYLRPPAMAHIALISMAVSTAYRSPGTSNPFTK